MAAAVNGGGPRLMPFLVVEALFRDPFQPMLLGWCAILGLALACVSARRFALVAGTWIVGLSVVIVFARQTDVNAAFGQSRYVMGLLPPVYALAAYAPAWLFSRANRMVRVAGIALGLLLFADALRAAAPGWTSEYDDQREYALLVKEIPRWKPGTTVRLFPLARAGCAYPQLAASEMVHARRSDVKVLFARTPFLTADTIQMPLAPWPPEVDDSLYFVDSACWRPLPEPALRPACAEFFQRYETEPVATETFATRPMWSCFQDEVDAWRKANKTSGGPITIGFYRIKGLRAGVGATSP